jgi:hypothetical protein
MTHWIPTSEAWAHVAFFERDKAQGRIFAELAEGKVLAWAKFFTLNNAIHRDAQVPRVFWDIHWTRLDFTSGEATRTVFDCFASIERGERVVKRHSSDRAAGVRIDRDALLTFWPPIIPGVAEAALAQEKPQPTEATK